MAIRETCCTELSMRPAVRAETIKRLRNVQGQIDGILRMLEEKRYCLDVLAQLKAVQQALISARNVVVEGYLESCMLEHIKRGNERKAIEELMSIIKCGD